MSSNCIHGRAAPGAGASVVLPPYSAAERYVNWNRRRQCRYRMQQAYWRQFHNEDQYRAISQRHSITPSVSYLGDDVSDRPGQINGYDSDDFVMAHVLDDSEEEDDSSSDENITFD